MKKITKAEFRRRVPVDHEFTGEFIGEVNTKLCGPGMKICRRLVLQHRSDRTISLLLDGPREGEQVDMFWPNTEVNEDGDALILVRANPGREPEPFLKITDVKEFKRAEEN